MSTYFIIEAGTLILSKPETTALTLELLRHYFYFSSCPETFDLYSSNAGYLGEPLLELLDIWTTLSLLVSIQVCRPD